MQRITQTIVGSATVLTVALGSVALGAQARYDPQNRYDGYDLPVFVSVVDGYAELDRAGQTARDIENVPLEAGDRVRTTRGRAELLFDDGSVLALDEHTALTFVSANEIDLVQGRVRVQWRDRGARAGLTVLTAAGQALIRTQGDYRITLADSRRGDVEIEVAVSRGSAELANALGRTIVREGTRALTTAQYAPSVPYAFSSPRDDFERWTDSLDGDRYGVESARYLPTELRYYGGVFDRHGAWQHHPSYGWVWYPRVGYDWRPYSGGRWTFVIGFGYSWVGGSRWSWPTHHHGRWDRVGTRWFWIPERPTQRRFVGYAAPRPSYSSTVAYYQRSGSTRGSASSWGQTPRGQAPEPRADRPAPRAVPRNQFPVTAPSPRVDAPRPQSQPQRALPRGSSAPPRAAAPEPRSAPQRAAPPPQRSAPPQRAAPTPRSEPPRASPPPRSGSRTPSRTAPPPKSGGDSRARSGTAVRRGGG